MACSLFGPQFLAAEHQKGGAPVCVLSEKFWHERFGGDPSAIGKPINLNGDAYTVVGVAPELVNSVQPAQLWVPLEPRAPWVTHKTNYLFATGLLRPGVTRARPGGAARHSGADQQAVS